MKQVYKMEETLGEIGMNSFIKNQNVFINENEPRQSTIQFIGWWLDKK